MRIAGGVAAGRGVQSGPSSAPSPACPTLRRRQRAPAGEHLVEHAPERPDVAAFVDVLATRLLRAMYAAVPSIMPTPVIMAGDVMVGDAVGSDVAAGIRISQLREPEIQHLHGAVRPHLDVGRLQVAMDDALLVRGLERFGDLSRDWQRLVDRDWSLAMRSASVGPSTSSITSAVACRRLESVDRAMFGGSVRRALALHAENGRGAGIFQKSSGSTLTATCRLASCPSRDIPRPCHPTQRELRKGRCACRA